MAVRAPLRAVEVLWEDCAFMQSWSGRRKVISAATNLVTCRTIGWFVYEDTKTIIVAATFGYHDPQTMISNSTIIPKKQIMEIRFLDSDSAKRLLGLVRVGNGRTIVPKGWHRAVKNLLRRLDTRE